MRMPGECYTEQIAGLEWHLERSRAQCERLKSALEAAEAENAELRARVAELEGRVPSDHRIRLFINSLRYYMRAAPYDSGDPYKNLEFLESVDAAAEWLETLPAAPVSPNGETEEV
jgi:predicted RNase H-like nuclease (RuvC/YqgF family)